jgi:hypothetical protein
LSFSRLSASAWYDSRLPGIRILPSGDTEWRKMTHALSPDADWHA